MIHTSVKPGFPLALKCIQDLPDSYFDRYENPFERKYAIHEKYNLPKCILRVFEYLEDHMKEAGDLFEDRLVQDVGRHYAGIFRYMPGDELKVHVDAGIHPVNGLRKRVTSLFYLNDSGGELEFWRGTSCVSEDPFITTLKRSIVLQEGAFVMFENDDFAWHGVTINASETPRIVATVSYLSNEIDVFENMRKRAYFVPRPKEMWPIETFQLRDTRADEKHYLEVYRA